MRNRRGFSWAAVALAIALGPHAHAGIRTTLRNAPRLAEPPSLGLGQNYRNAVDVIVDSVQRSLLTPASGSGVTYDTRDGRRVETGETFGPLTFVERPQTLGAGVFNLGVTFQYTELDQFDGEKVGVDRVPIATPSGPVLFFATPKFVYHLTTVNATYGITDDLDVNLALPIAAADNDTNTSRTSLFRTPPVFRFATEHSKVSIGVGDLHLRLKYRLPTWESLHHAVGIDVRMPTGDAEDALGMDTGVLGPYVAGSWVWAGFLEPHYQLAFNVDVTDVDRSWAFYAAGFTVKTCRWFDVAFDFLGRSDIDGLADESDVVGPHVVGGATVLLPYEGVDPGRKDLFDAQFGVRFRLYETLLLTLSVVHRLNDDGLRWDGISPVGGLQATF